MAMGLALGSQVGVWATRISESSPPITLLCYLTHSVPPSGESMPYAEALGSTWGLAQSGSAASACFLAALLLLSLSFAATLLRAARLARLCECPASSPLGCALDAASGWGATLAPSGVGLLCLLAGTGFGSSVVRLSPCASGAVGPSAAGSACALATALAALAANYAALRFPAPERAAMEDTHHLGYASLQ